MGGTRIVLQLKHNSQQDKLWTAFKINIKHQHEKNKYVNVLAKIQLFS